MAKVCNKEGCTRPVFSHGLCLMHSPKRGIKQTPLKKKPPKKVPANARSEKPRKRTPKKAAKRRKSVKTLKSSLDRVFSVYIRMRDADQEGFVNCITSGKRMWWRESQCGHFLSRRYNATRFHEQNCHAQSPYDNCYLAGNQYIYGLKVAELYGEDVPTMLVELSRTDFKFSIEWLEEKIAHYTKEVERLKREKGL
jgi:hypothetical protein